MWISVIHRNERLQPLGTVLRKINITNIYIK